MIRVPAPSGVKVKRYLSSSVTQEYIFQVNDCGFKLTFIPYDTVLRINSPRTPGISLNIDNDFNPVWMSGSQVLALAPVSAGGQLVSEIQDMYPYLCPANAMLHRAFTRSVLQNHPGASMRCGAVSSSLSSCNQTELDTLYDLSSYIFGDYTQFTRCISGSDPASDNVLHLFQLHANFFCDQMCVKAQIQAIVGTCPAPPEYTNVLNLLTC
ncbi:uncharacterized protein LOC131944148 [Physella acuta]|uniref:uncharacterized protein LOC131944148 n=1 Tax=Physella acuta TaxID=109671 RepID=UPI0027DC1B0B|nr:uncharacterized protein LOC131944148 [Physella acuta]